MAPKPKYPPEAADLPCENGSAYQQGCRCDPCGAGMAKANRIARRRKVAQQWGEFAPSTRVSPAKSRQLLRHAVDKQGLTLTEVARLLGNHRSSLAHIYHGRAKFVALGTEQALERVIHINSPTPVFRAPGPYELVPNKDWYWMYRGLIAQGWRKKDLRQILDSAGRNSSWLLKVSNSQILYSSYLELKWLVELIGDKRGPYPTNTAVMMKLYGHFPLIHYSEEGKLLRDSLTREQKAHVR